MNVMIQLNWFAIIAIIIMGILNVAHAARLNATSSAYIGAFILGMTVVNLILGSFNATNEIKELVEGRDEERTGSNDNDANDHPTTIASIIEELKESSPFMTTVLNEALYRLRAGVDQDKVGAFITDMERTWQVDQA